MNTSPLTEIFSGVVELSWRAGWLIAALAALRLAVRGRVPAQIWFVVWILVALRLLVPFSVPAGWSPYNLSPAQPLKTETAVRAATPVAIGPSDLPPLLSLSEIARPPAPHVSPAVLLLAGSSPWTTTEILARLWLAGFAILGAARLAASWSFRRQLRQAQVVTDACIATLVEQEAAGVRVTLVETDAVDAPALYGLVRPRLLLPPGLTAKLTDDELRHVVRHELGHWRRRDLLAQALMQAAVAVHWFNPLAWLAARLARADCELACDEFALRRESAAGASAYGATLLKVLGVVRGRRRPSPVVAMLEGKEQLTHRIRMIAGYRVATAGRVFAGVALIAAIAVASLTRESQAQEKRSVTTPAATTAEPAAPLPDARLIATPGASTWSSPAPPSATASGTVTPSGSGPAANSYTGVTTSQAGRLQVEALAAPNEEQRQKIEKLQRMLQEYREKSGAISLDSRREIVTDTLKALNLEAMRVSQVLNMAENRLNQIKERREQGRDLTELPFIASQPIVSQLTVRRAELQIVIARMGGRLRSQHPEMQKAVESLEQNQSELKKAIDTACAQVKAEHQAASRMNEQVKSDLAKQNEQVLALERLAADYERHERELRANEQLLSEASVRALEETRQAAATRASASADSRTGNPANAGAAAPSVGDFTISVIGAVNQQGGVAFSEKEKPILRDAIARSGGFSPRADRNAVRVIRPNPDSSRSTHTVTEKELVFGADPIGVLLRGDIVVVPEKAEPVARRASVIGQVMTPGAVQFPREGGLNLIEAISRAGGPTRRANLKKIMLKRVSADGAVSITVVNIDDVIRDDSGWRYPLQPGDVITVPERAP